MHLPAFLTRRLEKWARLYIDTHPWDKAIYGMDGERLLIYRWDVATVFGVRIRLHEIRGSDEDRNVHDHPWWNVSVVLATGYHEVMPPRAKDLSYQCALRLPGDIICRGAAARHRIVLQVPTPAISLFLHGAKSRKWGFWGDDGGFTLAPHQGDR